MDTIIEAANKRSSNTHTFFNALRVVGSEKSIGVLEEYVEKNKNKTDDEVRASIGAARKAIKDIERRMTVSSKPAEKTLEEAMRKKKVPA